MDLHSAFDNVPQESYRPHRFLPAQAVERLNDQSARSLDLPGLQFFQKQSEGPAFQVLAGIARPDVLHVVGGQLESFDFAVFFYKAFLPLQAMAADLDEC